MSDFNLNQFVLAMWVYCENLSSIGCLVAEKSLCGWAQAEIWWVVAQQNRVTPSPFDFGLWTLDLDLDLDCDNLSIDYCYLNSLYYLNVYDVYCIKKMFYCLCNFKHCFLMLCIQLYQFICNPNTQHSTLSHQIPFSD